MASKGDLMNRLTWLAAGLIFGSLTFTACGLAEAGNAPGDKVPPSRVEPVAGTTTSRVILTALAAQRLGIKTEPVVAASASGAGAGATSTVIPVGALIYDKDGGVWVYTAVPGTPTDANGLPLTFVRKPVTVARIDGTVATLQSGPAAGTQVVTEGGEELLGTEQNVEGQQA